PALNPDSLTSIVPDEPAVAPVPSRVPAAEPAEPAVPLAADPPPATEPDEGTPVTTVKMPEMPEMPVMPPTGRENPAARAGATVPTDTPPRSDDDATPSPVIATAPS